MIQHTITAACDRCARIVRNYPGAELPTDWHEIVTGHHLCSECWPFFREIRYRGPAGSAAGLDPEWVRWARRCGAVFDGDEPGGEHKGTPDAPIPGLELTPEESAKVERLREIIAAERTEWRTVELLEVPEGFLPKCLVVGVPVVPRTISSIVAVSERHRQPYPLTAP